MIAAGHGRRGTSTSTSSSSTTTTTTTSPSPSPPPSRRTSSLSSPPLLAVPTGAGLAATSRSIACPVGMLPGSHTRPAGNRDSDRRSARSISHRTSGAADVNRASRSSSHPTTILVASLLVAIPAIPGAFAVPSMPRRESDDRWTEVVKRSGNKGKERAVDGDSIRGSDRDGLERTRRRMARTVREGRQEEEEEGRSRRANVRRLGVDADGLDGAGPSRLTSSSQKKGEEERRSSRRDSSLDDVDDSLPHLGPLPLEMQQHTAAGQWPLNAGSVPSSFSSSSSSAFGPSPTAPPPPPHLQTRTLRRRYGTGTHHFTLPASFPTGIPSSWQPPNRSVWFQQKAIIITSIFLAIFIVLIIGAAVFLRHRHEDIDESDEATLSRMKNERRAAGMRVDAEADEGNEGKGNPLGKKKKARSKKDERSSGSGTPDGTSSGSSTAVRTRRIASRWAKVPARKLHLTRAPGAVDDSLSIRSGLSRTQSNDAARPRLGRVRDGEESIEIEYHDSSRSRLASISQPSSDRPSLQRSRTGSRRSLDPDLRSPSSRPSSVVDARRHSSSAQAGAQPGSVVPVDRYPSNDGARLRLDESDFAAAEEAEEANLPPAYIPSSQSGRARLSGPSGAQSPPPPHSRQADPAGSTEVDVKEPLSSRRLGASEAVGLGGLDDGSERLLALDREISIASASTGLHSAHVATDDKAVLSALSAAGSAPNALAPTYASAPAPAPAPASGSASASPSASATASAPGGSDQLLSPSAPVVPIDEDGFEQPLTSGAEIWASASASSSRPPAPSSTELVSSSSHPYSGPPAISPSDEKRPVRGAGGAGGAGAGKAENYLPPPPTALSPSFSPFDQPYQPAYPPGSGHASNASTPGIGAGGGGGGLVSRNLAPHLTPLGRGSEGGPSRPSVSVSAPTSASLSAPESGFAGGASTGARTSTGLTARQSEKAREAGAERWDSLGLGIKASTPADLHSHLDTAHLLSLGGGGRGGGPRPSTGGTGHGGGGGAAVAAAVGAGPGSRTPGESLPAYERVPSPAPGAGPAGDDSDDHATGTTPSRAGPSASAPDHSEIEELDSQEAVARSLLNSRGLEENGAPVHDLAGHSSLRVPSGPSGPSAPSAPSAPADHNGGEDNESEGANATATAPSPPIASAPSAPPLLEEEEDGATRS